MKTSKRILALVLAFVMMTALLTACGSKKDGAALSEKEYQDAVTELNEKVTAIQTDASSIDLNDPESAKKVLGDLKQPFNDFIAITPPEAYADAHAKLQSGCQAMVDYIDTVTSLLDETDEAKIQEASTKMMEQVQTAMADLTEGSTMLADAQK